MNLKEILSIAGQAGLYKYVAQGKGGIIVEALTPDAKRQMVSGSAKVSALGDIAIFTNSEEVQLADVFENIFKANNGEAVAVSSKSTPDELHKFMSAAVADYDQSRVHNSDIKKLAAWYNILMAVGVKSFKDEQQEEAPASAAVATATDKPKAARRATPATPTKSKSQASSKPKVTATKSTTARKSS